MKASIVIITKNQKSCLEKSIPVLLKQTLTNNQYEIIVVDSGSTDGALEFLKKLPVRVISYDRRDFNYAHAFNLGAAEAKGEILIRLSGDVIPLRQDFLEQMLAAFGDERVGGSYGKYTISGKAGFDYPDWWPASRFPAKLTRYKISPSIKNFLSKRKHLITSYAGGCCAMRRSIWQLQPWDESMSAADDAMYSWFLHECGYDIVYNPHAVVLHEHPIHRSVSKLWWQKIVPRRWQWQQAYKITKYYLLKAFGIDQFAHVKQHNLSKADEN